MKLRLLMQVFLKNVVLPFIDYPEEEETISLNELGNRIIETLQRHGKHNPMSIDELSRAVNYDIETNDELFEKLKRNPLIEYDDGTFRFRVSFHILFSCIARN